MMIYLMRNNKPKWFPSVTTIKSVRHEFYMNFYHKDFFSNCKQQEIFQKGKKGTCRVLLQVCTKQI